MPTAKGAARLAPAVERKTTAAALLAEARGITGRPSGWTPVAESNNFIVVYPSALIFCTVNGKVESRWNTPDLAKLLSALHQNMKRRAGVVLQPLTVATADLETAKIR